MAVTTFDFDPKTIKVMDQLKDHMHAASRAEVLRRAIALLKVASTAEKEGGKLVIKKGKQETQIVLG